MEVIKDHDDLHWKKQEQPVTETHELISLSLLTVRRP